MNLPMRPRQICLCLGLSLLISAGACPAPAPAPTGVVLLPSATFSPSPKPTYPPAVRDTATALALAAQLGGTPTLAASSTLSPDAPSSMPSATEAAASVTTAEAPVTETLIVVPSANPNQSTADPTRKPLRN